MKKLIIFAILVLMMVVGAALEIIYKLDLIPTVIGGVLIVVPAVIMTILFSNNNWK